MRALFVTGALLQACLAAANPLTPVDFVETPRISDPALSPDGRKLLYLRSATDWDANDVVKRYRLIDVATGQALPAPGPEDDDESFDEGTWGPRSACFVTRLKREDDEFRQLYRSCEPHTDLERLTQHNSSIADVHWAPDGETLYFLAPQQRSERDRQLLDDDWVIEPYDREPFREIWRLDLESGSSEPVITGDFSVRSMRIAADGDTLVYVRAPDQEPDSIHAGDVWAYDTVTREHRRWTQNDYREKDPQLSPDGTRLAFIATVNETGEPYYEDKVFVQTNAMSRPRRLLADDAMEALSFAWHADGESLFILGNTGLRTAIYRLWLDTAELVQLVSGDQAVDDWRYDPKNDLHVGRVVSAADPGNAAILDGAGRAFHTPFDEYRDWRARFSLPEQRAVVWRGRGGVDIEGLLVLPLDHDPDQRYPLVTTVHGGPRSSSQFGSWNMSRYVAVLAAGGYAVLLPNHRGGTGYGDAFMRDMVGNYFRNAQGDVLAGVDAMVARGIADPDRLVIMGWSAGGHMVNKLITMTTRFRAASSGAGASEWLSMHGESDVRHNRQFWFGEGFPWTRGKRYRRYRDASPLKDAWRVETPTLFFVGEKDKRVPPTQSILMYRGVRAAGADTELYVADGEGHGFDKPSHRLFKINTELAWFARHALGRDQQADLPSAADRPRDDGETGNDASTDTDLLAPP